MSGTALKMVVNWIYDTFSMKNELGLSDEEGRKVKKGWLHSCVFEKEIFIFFMVRCN